ncbi:MAG TPA: N,N-dimethylformamidase beta subunit family domain-containing protein [Cyclobacteriaceae bacterium]|jgi:hypothetical protein|nr:N,N-dimethylformamidase beta subunit family domain-containing protein [Cyclobacteriaceae bacterium]
MKNTLVQLAKRFIPYSFLWLLVGCDYKDVAVNIPVPYPQASIPQAACMGHIRDGYSDKVSYLPGERIKIYLNSEHPLDICRLTFYNYHGDSIFSIASLLKNQSRVSNNDPSVTGFGYDVSAEFLVPKIKSGIYLIEKMIPVIVKTLEPVDVMVIYPSNTANAYCESGGRGLYTIDNRPYQVSFQRPIPVQPLCEYCLEWFTMQNFSVGYVADVDLENYTNIQNAKILTIAGHSEYWTRAARLNFDRFVDNGGHGLILSGNTMWWQVRYTSDLNGLICYKGYDYDPISPPRLKTANWNNPALEYPITSSIGVDFVLGGYGLQNDNGWDGYKIASPTSPLLEGLNFAKGDILPLPTIEYDGAPITGYVDGYPVIDTNKLNFDKIELVGFDKGYRYQETTATFMVLKKKATSGIIVNTASSNWCSGTGMGGPSGDAIKKITFNAITKLLNNQNVFSN